MGSFDLLAELTARVASTDRLDEIVAAAVQEIVVLGFGAVWLAIVDEATGALATLKDVVDDRDAAGPGFGLDARQPMGRAFHERRMINVADPAALRVSDGGDAGPAEQLTLPRPTFDHLRGRPFACGPLLGPAGPVGAIALSSYRGGQAIPDAALSHGPLRSVMDLLAIAMERARSAARIERLAASLAEAQAALDGDARSKAIGDIAAAAAHDLNHLCGIAMLAVQVGARSPAEAFDMLPPIERATRAIADLATRLQRASRPAASGDTADVAQVIDDLLVLVKPVLRDRSIRVTTDVTPGLRVACDAALVQQVVLNLVINAHDALGEVAIERRSLELRARADRGAVRLVVTDGGPGFAPDLLPRAFEPFVTTKRDGHLGLGLAAIRASLARVGGTIEARNAATGGAQLEVSWPEAVAAPSPVPAATPAAPEPAAGAAPTRRARILAVDDDPDVLYIIRAFLEPLGYELATATSSVQAIETAGAEDFDLVLCDIGMPKHSGLDVCRLLRDAGYRGRFVLMTGWDSDSLRIDRRAADCDAMLKKPFAGADLIQAIDTLLAR